MLFLPCCQWAGGHYQRMAIAQGFNLVADLPGNPHLRVGIA
ncbi:hypothetical protein POH93_00950 [Phytobacter diazotrophicus]|nr:hypothetical protein [Phytobacter diazotrophicus]MDC0723947.1 hypothetical protein [Phytobacter diazotrophicus]MDC0731378.1 hypothetical protein [Phytobacter diazotrophicus]